MVTVILFLFNRYLSEKSNHEVRIGANYSKKAEGTQPCEAVFGAAKQLKFDGLFGAQYSGTADNSCSCRLFIAQLFRNKSTSSGHSKPRELLLFKPSPKLAL